jgi:hypothetical protein
MSDLEWLNRLLRDGAPSSIAMAVVEGRKTEAEALAQVSLCADAARIRSLPASERPPPAMAWDLDRARWHLSMDDHDAATFAASFPDVAVFTVGRVELLARWPGAHAACTGPGTRPTFRSPHAWWLISRAAVAFPRRI